MRCWTHPIPTWHWPHNFRQLSRARDGIHLGCSRPYFLVFQRDCSGRFSRMVLFADWSQAVLYVRASRGLSRSSFFVPPGASLGRARAFFRHFARHRRCGCSPASKPLERHVFPVKTGHGFRRVRNRGCRRADHRSPGSGGWITTIILALIFSYINVPVGSISLLLTSVTHQRSARTLSAPPASRALPDSTTSHRI